jgi:hypothetical protein
MRNVHTSESLPYLASIGLYLSPFESVKKEAAAQQALVRTEVDCGLQFASKTLERSFEKRAAKEDVLT